MNLLSLILTSYATCSLIAKEKPNIVFISVDDMNDWVGFLDSEISANTPNLNQLAKSGTVFTNAHCPSPKCGPSRSAIFSGLMPHNTGLYDNGHWWTPAYPNLQTLPRYFKKHGYQVVGSGKNFHHTVGFNPPNQWHDYDYMRYDDPWDRYNSAYPTISKGKKRVPCPKWHPLNGISKFSHELDWGAIPGKLESDYADSKTIDYGIDFLKSWESKNKPFFLACGLFHPHLPLYVPQKYLDMYPLEKITLPKVLEGDCDDLPPAGKKFAAKSRGIYEMIKRENKLKPMIQAYLASITYADHQIGRLLSMLKATGLDKNTIVVFWSDHGYHFGEKDHLYKQTLWQRSTRTPFIIADLRQKKTGKECSRAVNLIDIYPTLQELCQLPKTKLDGQSLVPWLKNPTKEKGTTLVTFGYGNHCLVDEDWRYINYNGKGEELYNVKNDPREWHNLVSIPKYKSVLKKYRLLLPTSNKKAVRTKGFYNFKWPEYHWEPKQKR